MRLFISHISPKVGYVRVFNWSDNIFGRPFVPFELLELYIMYYCMKTRLIAHMAKATRVNKLSIKTLEVFIQVGYHFFIFLSFLKEFVIKMLNKHKLSLTFFR